MESNWKPVYFEMFYDRELINCSYVVLRTKLMQTYQSYSRPQYAFMLQNFDTKVVSLLLQYITIMHISNDNEYAHISAKCIIITMKKT